MKIIIINQIQDLQFNQTILKISIFTFRLITDVLCIESHLTFYFYNLSYVPHDFVEIKVDVKQEGVARFNCWGDHCLPEYSVLAMKDYSNISTLIPIKNEEEIQSKLWSCYIMHL